jgi:hypothetical protein
MSVSTEVQRTLVKSPPELWSELSSPEALARHLGDFGEIRITKTEPETKVEWEAEEASGVVQLKQSGWGTKVTLSVTRTPAIPEQPLAPACPRTGEPAIVVEPEPEAATESQSASVVEPEPVEPEPEPVEPEPEPVEPEPEPVEPEPEPVEPEPEPEAAAIEPEPEPLPAEPEPQLGFFARLFRKRKTKSVAVVEPKPGLEPEKKPEIEVVAMAAPELVYPDPPAQPEASEPVEDLASELESLEEQMAAETTELLTGVLDRLGSAHHRPFSRG